MPEGVAGYYGAKVRGVREMNRQTNPEQELPTETEPPKEPEPETTEPTTAEPKTTKPAAPKPGEKGGDIEEKQYGETNETVKYKNILLLNRTASHKVNIEETLQKKVDLSIKKDDKPYVLIFHTHTTEAYQEGDWG